MSGGSYSYKYQDIENLAEEIQEVGSCSAAPPEIRRAFVAMLRLVAEAARAIEWNDSCDGDDEEEAKIQRCLAGRVDYRLRVAALEAELKEAKALNAIAACSYCGFQCAKDGTQIKDHVLSCEKNPAVALATEVIAATSRAERAERELTTILIERDMALCGEKRAQANATRAERVVAWLLDRVMTEGEADIPWEDVGEMLEAVGYLVQVTAGMHTDCEACEDGTLDCIEIAPDFARLAPKEASGA